ncbi:MerR family transcriptional regulator [Paenibacillus selenitireducens]|uniref:MerR family transcriptional regulator n=1 Tax=Paenibacillus selenitireducens TaxID=1324314 RepID=A0A1T2XCW8_9BACL|nr:MerR family transcriptional regulator [Paenibacillus selenitireducens]OPA77700.1 MerR family transcriptional regulator [Paenibacillus selenitireducens]
MKISQLSQLTGVSIRSLRYYEQQGLISADRESNGYRTYHPLVIDQVNTIKFYLNLGFTTEQIAGFLNCVVMNKEAFCSQILPIYREKLTEIEEQIQLLSQIKSNLEDRIQAVMLENPNPPGA